MLSDDSRLASWSRCGQLRVLRHRGAPRCRYGRRGQRPARALPSGAPGRIHPPRPSHPGRFQGRRNTAAHAAEARRCRGRRFRQPHGGPQRMRLPRRLLGGGDASIARARRPQALAVDLAEPPRQGLDWLGREPGPRAPWIYRFLVAIAWLVLRRICGLRLSVEGRAPSSRRLRRGLRVAPQLDRPATAHPRTTPAAARVVHGIGTDSFRSTLERAAAAPSAVHPIARRRCGTALRCSA